MHIITEKIKNRVIELKTREVSNDVIRVIIKEILQDYVLAAVYSDLDSSDMIFIGGTALRKLYNLNRFSEDLDFITPRPINYHNINEIILKYFKSIGFEGIDSNVQEHDFISRLTLKFTILKEIGLSGYGNEKLHVKLEATEKAGLNPKVFTKTLSNNPVVIKSLSLEELMAGKVIACLERVYRKGNSDIFIKGRDYYDLVWYMEQSVIPDDNFLKKHNETYEFETVMKMIDSKVAEIEFNDIFSDLQYFFEDYNYIKTWCENFHEIYKSVRKNYIITPRDK